MTKPNPDKRSKLNHAYIYDRDGNIKQVVKLKRTKGKGKSPRQRRLEERRSK